MSKVAELKKLLNPIRIGGNYTRMAATQTTTYNTIFAQNQNYLESWIPPTTTVKIANMKLAKNFTELIPTHYRHSNQPVQVRFRGCYYNLFASWIGSECSNSAQRKSNGLKLITHTKCFHGLDCSSSLADVSKSPIRALMEIKPMTSHCALICSLNRLKRTF